MGRKRVDDHIPRGFSRFVLRESRAVAKRFAQPVCVRVRGGKESGGRIKRTLDSSVFLGVIIQVGGDFCRTNFDDLMHVFLNDCCSF